MKNRRPNSNLKRYLVLIIYDIPNNKHRTKFAKMLSSYGIRVQKSAFEAYLNERQYLTLLQSVQFMLKPEDDIRIYKLPGYEEVLSFSNNKTEKIEDVIII